MAEGQPGQRVQSEYRPAPAHLGGRRKEGDHDETPIRRPALDNTDTETFEILRRYQRFGEFGDKAVSDAQLRMPLYAIFEKCNGIVRDS
ncbi:hypothetical protein [Streptomyces sp. NPDC001820]|uniref:hypothetical protein n=1 Tax=Streptomyces sp. NPDC001820 TaxID=3364613 RepID=UPI0036A9F8F9